MKITVTIIFANLVSNSLLSLFCSSIEINYKNQATATGLEPRTT